MLKVYKSSARPSEVSSQALGIFVFEGKIEESLKELEGLGKRVKKQAEHEHFTGKKESMLKVTFPEGPTPRVFLVGLGQESKARIDDYRVAAAIITKAALESHAGELYLYSPKINPPISQALAEGALLGAYRFDRYKTDSRKEEDKGKIDDLYIINGDDDAIERGVLFACGQNYARDLANEPPNLVNPATLAKTAVDLADDMGLECEIYDEVELERMGMNALLAVGRGSANPPRLIHLTYKPSSRPLKKIALVGKGLTFDSGGLDIKTSENMRTMKGDKTGACVVLGAMRSLVKLYLPMEVHALIGAVENMPSGSSYKPDDIIKTYTGKTIEIDNTDAEGRVTMADVLGFASKLNPSYMVDIATLTGGCAVALGPYRAGIFANDQALCNALLDASSFTGEMLWQLPMDDERLRKRLDSPFADVANSAGRYGSAITAAMFLREFVPEDIPWAHIDIAGVSYYKEPFGYYSSGVSGFGTRTILQWLYRLQ